MKEKTWILDWRIGLATVTRNTLNSKLKTDKREQNNKRHEEHGKDYELVPRRDQRQHFWLTFFEKNLFPIWKKKSRPARARRIVRRPPCPPVGSSVVLAAATRLLALLARKEWNFKFSRGRGETLLQIPPNSSLWLFQSQGEQFGFRELFKRCC